MKNYKHIIIAVLALSAMLFVATTQVSAEIDPSNQNSLFGRSYPDLDKSNTSDFNRGWNAGVDAGRENANSCYVSSNDLNIDARHSGANNMNKEKSGEFVAGFNAGLDESINLYNNSYCGM